MASELTKKEIEVSLDMKISVLRTLSPSHMAQLSKCTELLSCFLANGDVVKG